MTVKDFEIMAPVGSYESLTAAIQGGAGSIYFGVEGLNMRARSSNNFTLDDLREIARICRENGMKSYLTVNTVIYDNDIELMQRIIDAARDAGISAIIASDIAAMTYARNIGVEVHLSTQLNITNVEALKFYARYADVVVLARELNLDQVTHIHREIERQHITGPAGKPVRIEMFAHGALCMAVSGKCYLSLHEMNASANRGACMQVCRRGYTVRDKESDTRLSKVFNRGFWNGYYLGQRLGEWSHTYGSEATRVKVYIGKGIKYYSNLGVAEFVIETQSLHVGDEIVITGPTTGAIMTTVEEIRVDLKPVEEAVKGDHFSIKLGQKIRPSDKLYKWVSPETLKR